MSLHQYQEMIQTVLQNLKTWEDMLPPFETIPHMQAPQADLEKILYQLTTRLTENYPFFHPLYAGQMLKPPHPASIIAYLATMTINPNNHALDGGPATAKMENEAVDHIAKMFGYTTYLGHLTSSGTMANLEALWIARELNPAGVVIFSNQAHYTHKRMCSVLGIKCLEIDTLPNGKIDCTKLESALQQYPGSTIVLTLGTTGFGTLDPLDQILSLKEKYPCRIHVDAAYGGFYAVLKNYHPDFNLFNAIPYTDSIVVDPHKHGLQPYGCGCVIFSDPAIAGIYHHDSPYTYFSSPDLHLGEISLECSRAGASAAALWTTLQLFPLTEQGFGKILIQTREAALNFYQHVQEKGHYRCYLEPELDIVTYFPSAPTTSQISQLTDKIFTSGEQSAEYPLFLAKIKVPSSKLKTIHPSITVDTDQTTLLRSCFMKPEHKDWISTIIHTLEYHHSQNTSA